MKRTNDVVVPLPRSKEQRIDLYSSDDVDIRLSYANTSHFIASDVLFSTFLLHMVKHVDWLKGSTKRWNLWTLSSYTSTRINMPDFVHTDGSMYHYIGFTAGYETKYTGSAHSGFLPQDGYAIDYQSYSVHPKDEEEFIVSIQIYYVRRK